MLRGTGAASTERDETSEGTEIDQRGRLAIDVGPRNDLPAAPSTMAPHVYEIRADAVTARRTEPSDT